MQRCETATRTLPRTENKGPAPVRVIGYLRVSTAEQARDGASLAAQEDRIRAFCRLYGMELLSVESDPGFSASTLDRPGLRRALGRLEMKEADGLVVAKIDRLSRSIVDLGELIEKYFGESAGYHLASVADSIDTRSASGRLVLNVVMSVAQFERERIVERTVEVQEFKRRKGQRIGAIPFGWKLDENGARNAEGFLIELVAEPAEQAWVTWIRLRRDSGWSLHQIARELLELGVPTKRPGARWHPSTVKSILSRPSAAERES